MKKGSNLIDYKKVYREFRWKDHFSELDWFEKGKINAAHNAVTRHAISDNKSRTAIFWEDENGKEKRFTFSQLEKLSNKFANVLKKQGIKKGDRVFIFLPRIPETYIGFLGILKTGATAGTLFQAFEKRALLDRLKNSGAKFVLTDKKLKTRIDKIRKDLPCLKKIIIVDKNKVKRGEVSYQIQMQRASDKFNAAKMKPEDAAFMLYTSGTTGKPKGVIHTHYAILQQHLTAKWVLDLKKDDIYWCTADPGWVTGISYGILGNLSNGISSLVYSGRFSAEKWYSLIQKYKVTVWYTAPTAIRMLMKAGGEIVRKYRLRSLRHLCSVGEPLNPEAIKWGRKVFNLSFHDTWWQTETGSIIIANYPGLRIKLGSMGKPFPGIRAAILDKQGKPVINEQGNLAIKPGWPAMMKTIWRRKSKYESYFKRGWYFSGDKALQDKDGYFWFEGRGDDIINTRGERVGPFEVESALIEHPGIVEAAVIGKPDPLYGEIIKAYVVLAKDYSPPADFQEEIKKFVKKHLAGHLYPKEIEIRKDLPKTRSGKIMRRLLKAQELGLPVGDLSGLEK